MDPSTSKGDEKSKAYAKRIADAKLKADIESYNEMFREFMKSNPADDFKRYGPKKDSKEEIKFFIGVFGAIAAAFVTGVAVGMTLESKNVTGGGKHNSWWALRKNN